MKGEFEVQVEISRIPLSRMSAKILRNAKGYDVIVFTSKNAERIFNSIAKRKPSSGDRVIRVGPRDDLLKFDLKGKRLLFPRSALAPSDIIRKLRAKGAIVRVVPLYTASVPALLPKEKRNILNKTVSQLYFRSPSGAFGLARQFRGRERQTLFSIPVRCIGETTAKAARAIGFKRVFIG